VQLLQTLMEAFLKRWPERTIPTIEDSERPQEFGNGSIVNSESSAAQGRLRPQMAGSGNGRPWTVSRSMHPRACFVA